VAPTPGGSGSVKFEVTGQPTSIDNSYPYQSLPMGPGQYDVTIVPYHLPNAQGTAGAISKASLNIATFTPTPYIGMFAVANSSLTPIYSMTPATGTPEPFIVNLALNPNARIIAYTVPTTMGTNGGIIFNINTVAALDITNPYVVPPTLVAGSYIIIANPYSQPLITTPQPGAAGMIALQVVNYTATPTATP